MVAFKIANPSASLRRGVLAPDSYSRSFRWAPASTLMNSPVM
jgi:hypothetical protein